MIDTYEKIQPVLDSNGLLKDTPANGIKIKKIWDVLDWVENHPNKDTSLYQYNYVASTTPVSSIKASGSTSSYFKNPIIWGPSFMKENSKATMVPFLDAVKKFSETEYRLYQGLMKNAHMTRIEAMAYIDKNFDNLIGRVDLGADPEVLKYFKGLTSDTRDRLIELGETSEDLEWSPEIYDDMRKIGVLSSKRNGKGIKIPRFKSNIYALNVTNFLGHGVSSRGSRDTFSEEEGNKNADELIKLISSNGEEGSVPAGALQSYRSYGVHNICEYGVFKVIEFEVIDWDTFLKVLNYLQENDSYQ